MFRQPMKRDNLMNGSGLFTTIKNNLPSSDENARPGFPGENHAILKLPGNKMGVASYMGPGTEILKRLKRGDPPRTASDAVAKLHDINFGLAQYAPTREKQREMVRDADNRMISKLKDIEKKGLDSKFNTLQGKKLIQLKVKAENKGLLSKDKFSGPLLPADPEAQSIYAKERDKMIQQGYGKHPVDLLKKKTLRQLKKKKKTKSTKMKGKGDESLKDMIQFAKNTVIPSVLKKHNIDLNGVQLDKVKNVLKIIGKDHLKDTGDKARKRLARGLKPLLSNLISTKM